MALFLYDAIKLVLRKNARPMTTEEIANQLNATKLYVKSNKTPLSELNIHFMVYWHPEMFKYDIEKKMVSFNPSYKETKPESEAEAEAESGNKFKL